MYPSSSRPTSHSVMAQQGGYFGYYPQQAPHPIHATEFTCNFQSIVPSSQMPESFQGTWYNTPMYMGQSPHHSAVYQQRAQSGYEDWTLGGGIPHNLSSGATSPLPLYSVPPSSSTSSTNSTIHSTVSGAQPPHTPSPCALPNGTAGGQSPSSYYPTYIKRPSSEFAEIDGPHSNSDVPISDVSVDSHKSPTHGLRPQQTRSPYEWMKKSYQTPNGNMAEETTYIDIDNMTIKGSHDEEEEAEIRESSWKVAGKTRTKDKYRVVYSDHQRLELEKEFHYSRYITIRRKSELAGLLGLSERQVKIWFQNRRAKERKQMKKREEIVNKDKMDTGIAFHHGPPPLHPLTHHHPHQPPPQPHPNPIHAHSPHHNQHHSLAHKAQSLMMDVKPTLSLD